MSSSLPNVKKAAFVVGGEYGKGFAECRNTKRHGLGRAGGREARGRQRRLPDRRIVHRPHPARDEPSRHGSADAGQVHARRGRSIAAGPVGRTAAAQTDARLDAEILAWSRSKGLFAGVSLKGAVLRPDEKENADLYGHAMTNKEFWLAMSVPANARALALEFEQVWQVR